MKISARQVCFILFTYTAATKLLMYPTVLSITCGRDLLFPALFDFAISTAVVWCVSFLCSKTDKTFFGLLEGTLGNIGARIVYGLFAVFFLFACLLPLFEHENYVHNIFYDTVPSIVVFLPFFIFSAYACSKKFENIGRCADICLPIFIAIMLFMFVMAFNEVEWDNLLPVLKTPANRLFQGTVGTAYSFVEPCWLLMFMGHFKYKKGDALKITLSYAGGAFIVLVFLAVFYGIYGALAPSRTYAVSRTSLFFPAIETIGRVDIILLLALETVLLFALVLNMQLAVHAIAKCSGYDNRKIISLAVNAALLIVLVCCTHFYNAIFDAYFSKLWIMFVIFTVVIPPLAWVLKRRRTDER